MPKVVPSQVIEVIDQVFPYARYQKEFFINRDHQNEVATIAGLVDQIPTELLTLGQRDYSTLQLAVTALKITITTWQKNDFSLKHINGYGNINPVTIIRNTLSKCPDEGISKSTSDLTFISVQELRCSLQIDISSANQAFQNGEWKATTVLAGATIEALLLYTLDSVQNSDRSKISSSINSLVSKGTFKNPPVENLDEWSIFFLVEVAADLSLIKEETATQVKIVRNFRNLIHPGVSVRKNIVCNRGTALSALAGLEHIINDLSATST
jgi:hypothetical protein